jgi:alpha-D-xyloside xylohydrolase
MVLRPAEEPLNLLRCAWAGSQRYGALVWSGDIDTTFRTLREQFAIGLSMAMAGIPWWTTDIGGFHGGDQNDPDYRELIIRCSSSALSARFSGCTATACTANPA